MDEAGLAGPSAEAQADDAMQEMGQTKEKSKRNRPRHQKLYADIRKQMEFYFSDANVTKNRMMRDMVQGSEYAALDVFLTFNRISTLTKNIEELQKALKKSEKLELSPDGRGVKRKIPFDETKLKDEAAIESCTIYVENIPKNVGHEWIEKIFQEFGSIAYVSLPKFRNSGQPKGFAFIEFDEQIGADRCLEAYGSMGACLSSNIDPGNLLSVKSFEEENPSRPGSLTTSPEYEATAEQIGSDRKLRKRGHDQVDKNDNTSEASCAKKDKHARSEGFPETVESNSRKRKLDDTGAESHSLEENGDEIDSSKKQKLDESKTLDEDVPHTSVAESGLLEVPIQEKGSKKRKRNRKRNKKNQALNNAEVKLENDSIQLMILPKANWRKLRNRYLNLQRENMSKLKKQLRLNRERMNVPQNQPVTEKRTASKSICVKITLKEPAESVDSFRSLISRLSPQDWSNFLKHIDYNEGEGSAIVRFDGGPQAVVGVNMFFQNAAGLFKDAAVMSEEEAMAYWVSAKKNQSKQKKIVRGKDRLTNEIMKGAIHIRFDDTNDGSGNTPRGSAASSGGTNDDQRPAIAT